MRCGIVSIVAGQTLAPSQPFIDEQYKHQFATVTEKKCVGISNGMMGLGAWGATLSAHGSYKHTEQRAIESLQGRV